MEKIGRETPAPAYENWTDADEARLLHLTTQPIYIGDTALGRHQLVKKMELHAAVDSMSKEERDELREKMNAADEMEVNDDEMSSVPILPNTKSTPAADLFPDDMIDDEDTELIQESVSMSFRHIYVILIPCYQIYSFPCVRRKILQNNGLTLTVKK